MKKLMLILLLLSSTSTVFAGVDFDANGDLIQFGTEDDILKEDGATTIAVWVYPEGPGASDEGFVVSRGDGSGRNRLQVAGATTTNGLYWVIEGSTYLVHADSNAAYTNSVWQAWTMDWDGSTTAANSNVKINNTALTYDTTTNGSGAYDNSTFPLCIGARGNGASNSFNGVIDEVTLFNTQKSAAVVALLATSRLRGIGLNFNPTRYFALDGCAEGVSCATGMFKDVTQQGGSGTVSGNPLGAKNALNYPPAII